MTRDDARETMNQRRQDERFLRLAIALAHQARQQGANPWTATP